MKDEDAIEDAQKINDNILISFDELGKLADRNNINNLKGMFTNYYQSAESLAKALLNNSLTGDERTAAMKEVAASASSLNVELPKFYSCNHCIQ